MRPTRYQLRYHRLGRGHDDAKRSAVAFKIGDGDLPVGQTVLLGLEVTAVRERTSIEAGRHEPAAAALMVERRRNRTEEMACTEPT